MRIYVICALIQLASMNAVWIDDRDEVDAYLLQVLYVKYTNVPVDTASERRDDLFAIWLKSRLYDDPDNYFASQYVKLHNKRLWYAMRCKNGKPSRAKWWAYAQKKAEGKKLYAAYSSLYARSIESGQDLLTLLFEDEGIAYVPKSRTS